MLMGASTEQGYHIATKSREIVRSLISDKIKDLSPEEKLMVERIVHSTADPEYAEITAISPDFVKKSLESIKEKKGILTDINMVKAGINSYDGSVKCYINNEDTINMAKKEQITRAAAAMRVANDNGFQGIIVIGNAPTALIEAIDLIKNRGMKVNAIVGVPVGFVGAAESKKMLMENDIPSVVTKGPKGGTPVAVAVINSIIGLAGTNSEEI